MADRSLTLMAVHAHPDDEATGTGGTLARYAAEGVRTVLVTCTDGRCGDGPGGVKPGDPGHDPDAVVQQRYAELDASCAALKVSDSERLGYGDSGMMGWATNEAPGAFWTTPVPEAAAKLAALIGQYRPDVVVTYDANGFYGHPDHIQTHRVTVAALELVAGTDAAPAKFYYTTAPRSGMERMFEVMKELGADWDEPASGESDGSDGSAESAPAGPPDDIGLPDDEITTWIDIGDFIDAKLEALTAHASQSDNIMFLRMGRDRFAELMGVEPYLRVKDTTGAATPEDDLFAGLR